jgi:hypothetical protein
LQIADKHGPDCCRRFVERRRLLECLDLGEKVDIATGIHEEVWSFAAAHRDGVLKAIFTHVGVAALVEQPREAANRNLIRHGRRSDAVATAYSLPGRTAWTRRAYI